MNLALEKRERVTTEGRGEIRVEVGKVTGMVSHAPNTNSLGIKYGAFGGWQLEKWRYCWWLVAMMWTQVQKPSLSTCMS